MDKSILKELFGKVEIETIMNRIKNKKLSQAQRNYLSRSIKPKLRAAQIITQAHFLDKLQRPDLSIEKKIIFNLDRLGYTLISNRKTKKQKAIPIEELIGIIIAKCPKARYIEAIPMVILKNDFNMFTLVEIAERYNIKNQLGYLLETANIIGKKGKRNKDLTQILNYFKQNISTETGFLAEEKSSAYTDFLIKTSPKRMKKWNLLGRFFDEDFLKLAAVYL